MCGCRDIEALIGGPNDAGVHVFRDVEIGFEEAGATTQPKRILSGGSASALLAPVQAMRRLRKASATDMAAFGRNFGRETLPISPR
jgi:hypothetical protein